MNIQWCSSQKTTKRLKEWYYVLIKGQFTNMYQPSIGLCPYDNSFKIHVGIHLYFMCQAELNSGFSFLF